MGLAIILVLAAVLRLGAPGIVEFRQDEANLSELALNMAHGHGIPLLGIDSSVGIRNAPMNVYIMALPYLLTSDPVVATQFVGLLNVIAVGLTYGMARRYYGPVAAFFAGLMFAVGPWAVIYSRKIWAQDMLSLFVVLTVGTGLLAFIEGKRWAQLLHLPLLALTGQIHYVAFVLIPITLYLLIVGRRRLTRAFLMSFGLAILVVLPYAVGAVQASLFSSASLSKFLSGQKGANSDQPPGSAVDFALYTVAGTNLDSVAGSQESRHYLDTVPNAYPLFDAFALVILIATAWLLFRTARSRDGRSPVDIMLVIWLLFTPLIFLIPWTAAYPHYMIPIFPAAYLIFGAGIGDLWRSLPKQGRAWQLIKVITTVAVMGTAVLQVWLLVALHMMVNSLATPGGFSTPLGYYLPIRAAILEAHPQAVLANLDGQYIGYHEETSIWNTLLYDVPSVRFLDQNTEVYPAGPALYLSHNCTPTTERSYLRPGEPCLAISTRSASDYDRLGFTPVDLKGTFANGARVIAYHWEPTAGGCLSVAWTVSGPRPEDFNFAVHFVNQKGDEILNADGLSWRGRYWQAGDIVVRRFCPSDTQGRLSEVTGVRLGMYTYEDTAEGRKFYGVDLLDAAGAPAGSWVEIKFTS